LTIAAVDIDRICKELDVYTLQENIDHLTFCNIENEIVSVFFLIYKSFLRYTRFIFRNLGPSRNLIFQNIECLNLNAKLIRDRQI
jgi:hypothetical protein